MFPKINKKVFTPLPFVTGFLFLLLISLSIVIVSISNTNPNSEKDQNPPLFEFPTTHDQITIYAITQVEDGLFTLAALSSGETKIIKLQNSIPVELIQGVQPSEIKIGDWLTIIGVRDTVRSFRITALVLMESVEKINSDGIGFSPSGFTGAEGFLDESEAIKGGKVTSLTNNPEENKITISLMANNNVTKLILSQSAPLYYLSQSAFSEVSEGKNIAIKEKISDSSQAILILDF